VLVSIKGRSYKRRLTGNTAGFTLVELNVSVTILAILAVGLLSVFTNFFVVITRTNQSALMTTDSQNLLRTVGEELRYGAGVRSSATINDPNAPSGGWNTSNSAFVIIVAVPATDSSHSYIIDPNTGNPYLNELVYYKNGSTLYKRILANPNAVGNILKTSCPANLATSTCPADRKLVENLKSMLFTLYDQDDATTTDPLLARSFKIDLILERITFGAPITVDNSIRVTLRNTF
jgi:prepilin-type N-terminal cleavage/methylation domain-containing protein